MICGSDPLVQGLFKRVISDAQSCEGLCPCLVVACEGVLMPKDVGQGNLVAVWLV